MILKQEKKSLISHNSRTLQASALSKNFHFRLLAENTRVQVLGVVNNCQEWGQWLFSKQDICRMDQHYGSAHPLLSSGLGFTSKRAVARTMDFNKHIDSAADYILKMALAFFPFSIFLISCTIFAPHLRLFNLLWCIIPMKDKVYDTSNKSNNDRLPSIQKTAGNNN